MGGGRGGRSGHGHGDLGVLTHDPKFGLDLGARTPEETAVSVAAEIVALRRRGSGRRLTTTGGPIHRP